MGSRLSALTAISLAILVMACSPAHGSSSASPTPLATGCRPGPPEAGVHNPDRLQILDPCKHVEGIVVDVAHEDDGDYHVWFRPDADTSTC